MTIAEEIAQEARQLLEEGTPARVVEKWVLRQVEERLPHLDGPEAEKAAGTIYWLASTEPDDS